MTEVLLPCPCCASFAPVPTRVEIVHSLESDVPDVAANARGCKGPLCVRAPPSITDKQYVCLRQALPPFLRAVVDRLVQAGVYSAAEAPNHCLVNEYRDGAGIPPHDDGPLYLNKVAI